jgi:hypothetical protein
MHTKLLNMNLLLFSWLLCKCTTIFSVHIFNIPRFKLLRKYEEQNEIGCTTLTESAFVMEESLSDDMCELLQIAV